MRSNGKGYLTRMVVLAVAVFLALPALTFAQHGRGRRNKDEVFVNGHDARDGRHDGRGPRRDRRDRRDVDGDGDYDRRDEYIIQQERRNNGYGRDARDQDGDGDYDRRDEYIIQQRQRNGGYGDNGGYNNGGYRNRGYGNYGNGNYSQSQQTALNAGYN
ncbi:MAG TPA: hypothetical protein VF654_01935, partial [Pyrinomonadaceae bacterium]